MPKSFQKMCSEAADLCAIARLTWQETVAVSISKAGITIQVRPLDLARISKAFKTPRSRVNAHDDGNSNIFIDFTAKGATWACVILRERVAEFYEALGGDPQLLLTAKPQSLPQRQLHLLESK